MNNEEFIFFNDNFEEEGNEIEKNKENINYFYSLIVKNNTIYIKKDTSKEDKIKENNIPDETGLIDFNVEISILFNIFNINKN